MTSHRPPMWHGFCFTGINFESFFFFFYYYCQFQEDLSSFDNHNQWSKNALKKPATSHISRRRRNHFWIGSFLLWHLRAASHHIRPRPARSVSSFICLDFWGVAFWKSQKRQRAFASASEQTDKPQQGARCKDLPISPEHWLFINTTDEFFFFFFFLG